MTSCNLVGPLGVMIQLSLFVICLFALLYKRQVEKPRRSLVVFFLDLSKQGFAQMAIHCLNILISKSTKYECASYLFISGFDTFVGLVVNYYLLLVVNRVVNTYELHHLLSGNYFTEENPLGREMIGSDFGAVPASQTDIKSQSLSNVAKGSKILAVNYSIWASQVLVWVSIVLTSKFILYYIEIHLIFMVEFFHKVLQVLDPTLKIILVLVIAPACFNCLMVWIQDNLLKKNDFSQEEKDLLYNFFYEGEDLFNDADEKNSDPNSSGQPGSPQLSDGDPQKEEASFGASHCIEPDKAVELKSG